VRYSVDFSATARDQLVALDAYLAEVASPGVAARYVDGLLDFCYSLSVFPERGTRRDDIRPGLRVTHFRGRTLVAIAVDARAKRVSIVGIFHAGRDFESVLSHPRDKR